MFHDQSTNVPVYASFLSHIGVIPSQVREVDDIPFLPIRFFKTHKVLHSNVRPEIVFTSSGTGGDAQSRHLVADLAHYEDVCLSDYEMMYGALKDFGVFALLPSYLERGGSSLIYMVDRFIRRSGFKGGFYLDDHDKLLSDIRVSEAPKKLLIGVSFALLDLAEKKDSLLKDIPGLVVMETGGMKGRRKEITRTELHDLLKEGFGISEIHSEYGMTELLSQAYSRGDGYFNCPPWMRVSIREIDDPFSKARIGKTGGINVIDLANKDSCAFIATDDLGRMTQDGRFEVLGRFDFSDSRGCNLMI